MSKSKRSTPTNAQLQALIEQQRIELQQLKAALHTELRTAMQTATQAGLQRQHAATRDDMGALRAQSSETQRRTVTMRMSELLGVPFGRRSRRLGVGLGLASLLLLAPWGSGMSYAAPGVGNTAYGDSALINNTGTYDSAFGTAALYTNTGGDHNQASGSYALFSNTTGHHNSASGADALYGNDTGSYNTASGYGGLYSNTTGSFNSASGYEALYSSTTGGYNSASGSYALSSNTTGFANVASGFQALTANTTGARNTASGYASLSYNTAGNFNTASGSYALASNTTGVNNTAVGYVAGYTDTPGNANTTGSNNTFIGYNSGPGTPSEITNATAIGANAVVSQSNSIVLGGTDANTQRVGVGTSTPHSAFQVAKGFLQLRPIVGEPAPAQCVTADDAGRLVVRTDGNINLYVCLGTGGWIGK